MTTNIWNLYETINSSIKENNILNLSINEDYINQINNYSENNKIKMN